MMREAVPDPGASFRIDLVARPTEAERWLEEHYPPFFDWSAAETEYQDAVLQHLLARFVPVFGFAGVTGRAISELAQVTAIDRIVEVGAGSGYLAWELRARGFDVAPTDPVSWLRTWYGRQPGARQWLDTAIADHMTVLSALSPDYNLLLSWPAGQCTSADVPRLFPGRYIIYVPETCRSGRVEKPIDDALVSAYRLVAAIELFPVWSEHDVMEVWERLDYSSDARPLAEPRFYSTAGGGRRVPPRAHE